MDMIGHQAIRVYLKVVSVGRVCEAFEIKAIVVLAGKNGITVIAALDDVLGLAFDEEPGQTRHWVVLYVSWHEKLKANTGE